MSRLSGRKCVENILAYLDTQQMKSALCGDRTNSHLYKVAWHVLYLAFFKGEPDPVGAALRQHPFPPVPFYSPVFLNPPPAALVFTPWMLDGRNGRQWTTSVLDYLAWRSGQRWRCSSERFHDQCAYYQRAMVVINHAFNSPDPAPGPAEVRHARAA